MTCRMKYFQSNCQDNKTISVDDNTGNVVSGQRRKWKLKKNIEAWTGCCTYECNERSFTISNFLTANDGRPCRPCRPQFATPCSYHCCLKLQRQLRCLRPEQATAEMPEARAGGVPLKKG